LFKARAVPRIADAMDDVIAYFQRVFEARRNFRQPKEGSVVVGEWRAGVHGGW
jgi:hypothetical protein